MDETSQAVQAFLFKMGFRQAQSEQPSYWVRTVDDLTRQAMTMAIGYVQGETLFSLWIEKLDLFQKYLQRDEVSMLNVVRVNLAKNGLYRIGESGRRGWTAREGRSAVDAVRTVALPWLDRHTVAATLIKAVESGQSEGPNEAPKRRLFGLLAPIAATPASAFELTAGDKERLGNLYLEAGRLKDAHLCYSDYLSMMGYTEASSPYRTMWLDALERLRAEAEST